MITSQAGALDYFCGPGYQELYLSSTAAAAAAEETSEEDTTGFYTDTLVSACMFRVGSADGFVRLDLELEPALLLASTKGVAVQFEGQRRIWSGLLLLPLLQSQRTGAEAKVPSTRVPEEMTKYLLASSGSTRPGVDGGFMADWEEFLYKVIHDEPSEAWALWTAVCTVQERDEHSASQRLVAHWCNGDDNDDGCCWIFDPERPPRVTRHYNEEDGR